MLRPNLKRLISACVILCAGVSQSQTRAQEPLKLFPNIPTRSDLKADLPIAMPTIQSISSIRRDGVPAFSGAVKTSSFSGAKRGLRYPADLQYHGGPVIDRATQHALFINPTNTCMPNSCWGNPIGFLSDLGRSELIHIADQYTDAHEHNRYAVGDSYYFPYAPSAGAGKPFTNLDLAIAAYSVAAQTESFGQNNIYHLFLVPGQDVCFDSTFSNCYSPDNLKAWSFCAFHGSVHDSAGNVVIYTVEPYQNVSGCNVGQGTPNGQLVDSTNNVLSHELIETITDPKGTAWWNDSDLALYGQEIGDECEFLLFTPTDVFFDPSVVRLNKKLYAIQPEYDNSKHACSSGTD